MGIRTSLGRVLSRLHRPGWHVVRRRGEWVVINHRWSVRTGGFDTREKAEECARAWAKFFDAEPAERYLDEP
ncbi:hypothetical protein ABZ419_11280 [Streptomyces cinnamoneus]|uniref:hypothetical protein n=1 Tax=Streptomyces cinnamoneus TaxID=53446 RepID=UPI0033D47972